jgi:hypothetical protein
MSVKEWLNLYPRKKEDINNMPHYESPEISMQFDKNNINEKPAVFINSNMNIY